MESTASRDLEYDSPQPVYSVLFEGCDGRWVDQEDGLVWLLILLLPGLWVGACFSLPVVLPVLVATVDPLLSRPSLTVYVVTCSHRLLRDPRTAAVR